LNYSVEKAKEMAEKIFEHLGELSHIRLFRNQVLVAISIRASEMEVAGGHKLYLPDKTVDEDKFQSKPGLIVKVGPTAFQDDTEKWFVNDGARVGDWVFYRPSDGWSIGLYARDRKTLIACRILDDISLRGVTTDPGSIW
jgi:hypothetical protein